MEQNNANDEDAHQSVDVGIGVDVNLNDQLLPAGGVEQAEPVIDRMENGGEREEDLNRDANVRNHMAALLKAIQQNRVALRPVAKRHGVRHEVAQVAAGDDAAADAAEARVSAAAAQPQPDGDQNMVGPDNDDEIMGDFLIRPRINSGRSVVPCWADLQPSSGTDDISLGGLCLALVCQAT